MKLKNLIKSFRGFFKHDCKNCSVCAERYVDIKMVHKK